MTETQAGSVKPTQKSGNKETEKGGYWWGTGRRKSSVARVRIRPGGGKLLINKRALENYFTRDQDQKAVMAPLKAVEAEKAFDVFINVRGGGTSGQAGASLLGIARALKNYNDSYHPDSSGQRPSYPGQQNGRAKETGPERRKKEIPVLEALICKLSSGLLQ